MGSVPGSVLGAWLLSLIPGVYVRLGLILALPLVALSVLKNKDLSTRASLIRERWSLPGCFVIGLLIGVYDGLVGPGTGTFLILAYVMFLGEEALTASGTAKLVNLGSNFGALLTLITTGHVLYALALPAAVFGIAGNLLGSSLAIHKGASFIRRLLLLVLTLLLVKLLIDLLPEIQRWFFFCKLTRRRVMTGPPSAAAASLPPPPRSGGGQAGWGASRRYSTGWTYPFPPEKTSSGQTACSLSAGQPCE